jgi:ribosomal protein S18 acetylase RimI-like enzyme
MISICEYTPADDAACKELEVTASQFQALGGLVKFAFHHFSTFDAKPSQFSDHLILLAKQEDTIVGVVCVAIKRAWVHGAEHSCGFVFDLRVRESHQRRGIGSQLTAALESHCKKRGVTFLYLSVNNDNSKARALYSREQWHRGSRRALIFRPLLMLPSPRKEDLRVAADCGGVSLLTHTEAKHTMSKYFARRDLGLTESELDRLLASECYLGTYMASDGKSSAALSLWHGSTFTTFAPVRIFLPISYWSWLAPLLAGGIALAAFMASRALVNASTNSVLRAAAAAVCAGVGMAGSSFARFVYTRKAFRARAFAPVTSGPGWEPLMRAVHARLASDARARGFGVLIINEDVTSPLVACLGAPARSPTSFWQKVLQPATVEPLSALQSDMFFDPRDM